MNPEINRSAIDTIAEIVRLNPAIEKIVLVSYSERPSWREGRAEGWIHKPGEIEDALRQDDGVREFREVERADLSIQNLWRFIDIQSGLGRLVGITSRVLIRSGEFAHIPMMDFLCPPSEENLKTLLQVFGKVAEYRGFILNSGNSYHYYGTRLLTDSQWRTFLGRSLLLSGLSDDRYIGHQLVDGYCVLRISAGMLKRRVPMEEGQIGV